MTKCRSSYIGAMACVALAALAALSPAAARAGVIAAIEPNNTFATAQNINNAFTLDFNPNIGLGAGAGFVNTSTTIPNVTILRNNPTGGLDYFSFTTLSAGLLILDIDSSPQNTNFDTHIFLFNAAGNPLASNDDNDGDPGDGGGAVGGLFNSRIETGVLAAGNYVVGVAAFPASSAAGGVITGGQIPANGSYTLHVSANSAVIPEPGTLALAAFGLVGVAGRGALRRRKTRA